MGAQIPSLFSYQRDYSRQSGIIKVCKDTDVPFIKAFFNDLVKSFL